ncbi:MAG: 50S ribosomal protein L22 [Patescibacteria group bacterium]
MAVTIKLRFVRHSARKLRPVGRLFVGKNLEQAIDTTSLMPQQSAYFFNKAFKMAKAAATAKEFSPDKLVVTTISATTGPRVKRVRPNARGRANAYQKHLAHIAVTVEETKEEKKKK